MTSKRFNYTAAAIAAPLISALLMEPMVASRDALDSPYLCKHQCGAHFMAAILMRQADEPTSFEVPAGMQSFVTIAASGSTPYRGTTWLDARGVRLLTTH